MSKLDEQIRENYRTMITAGNQLKKLLDKKFPTNTPVEFYIRHGQENPSTGIVQLCTHEGIVVIRMNTKGEAVKRIPFDRVMKRNPKRSLGVNW